MEKKAKQEEKRKKREYIKLHGPLPEPDPMDDSEGVDGDDDMPQRLANGDSEGELANAAS